MAVGPLIGCGRTADVHAYGDGRVLKLFRPDMPEALVDRELGLSIAVMGCGVPCPTVEPGKVLVDGRMGIVYGRVAGPSLMGVTASQPYRLAKWAGLMATVHLDIHSRTVMEGELPDQAVVIGNIIDRSTVLPDGLRSAAKERLARLPGGNSVCHGDLHPDNIIVADGGPVVIDWMTATRGNPIGDVARTWLLMMHGMLPKGMPAKGLISMIRRGFAKRYLACYGSTTPIGDDELGQWLVPLAAARTAEYLPTEEKAMLVRLIGEWLE